MAKDRTEFDRFMANRAERADEDEDTGDEAIDAPEVDPDPDDERATNS